MIRSVLELVGPVAISWNLVGLELFITEEPILLYFVVVVCSILQRSKLSSSDFEQISVFFCKHHSDPQNAHCVLRHVVRFYVTLLFSVVLEGDAFQFFFFLAKLFRPALAWKINIGPVVSDQF